MRQILPFVLTLFSFFVSVVPGGAQMRKITAETRALPEADAFHPGGDARIALRVTLPQGFHMQSNRPLKPLLVPTSLQAELPAGVEITELVYPKTIALQQEDVEGTLAVFEREYDLGIVLRLAAGLKPGDLAIPLKLRYQPCDEGMCYPPVTVDSPLTLKIIPASDPLTPMNTEALEKIPFGSGLPFASASAAAPVPDEPEETPASGDGTEALERFTVAGAAGGYLKPDEFLAVLSDAKGGVTHKSPFAGRGLLVIALLVLLGGFALNLTPCVLPMIPINLAIIGAGTAARSPRRGFVLGGVYGLAMAVAYGALGLVVVFGLGNFGDINAKWGFNAGIALLFVFLALAMFDILTLDFSRFSSKLNLGDSTGGLAMAFVMGAISAVLAGACVAPVLIQVMALAIDLKYRGNVTGAAALPVLLGTGMGLPWPFVGAGIGALPRPGAWMVRVKQGFGVLILVMACYYGWLAWRIFSTPAAPAPVARTDDGWYNSLAEGLAAAERENRPALVDMWASWCKNCTAMEHTTFKDAKVKEALAGYVKIRVEAENPDAEPARTLGRKIGAVGLPAYAVLKKHIP